MCDYLPLCGLVIIQPLAAEQEIMKSQTHCASQWMEHSYHLIIDMRRDPARAGC